MKAVIDKLQINGCVTTELYLQKQKADSIVPTRTGVLASTLVQSLKSITIL